MSKFGSASVGLFVDGHDLTPAIADSISHENEIITEKTNAFGHGAEGNSPTGMTRGTIVVSGGMFDKVIDPLHAAAVPDGGIGVSRVVCVFELGQTQGAHFTGYEGVYSQKSAVIAKDGALTQANVAYAVDGRVDDGVILQERATKVADWDTHLTPVDAADDPTATRIDIVSSSVESGATSIIETVGDHHLVTGDVVAIFEHTSVAPDINDTAAAQTWTEIGHTVTVIDDRHFSIPVDVTDAGLGGYCVLCSHAGGGHGYQQILDGGALTGGIGTIKHSVDGSTWATLLTFTDMGTADHVAQCVATASLTTQVGRYLAYYFDGTGFGSVEAMAGFARG